MPGGAAYIKLTPRLDISIMACSFFIKAKPLIEPENGRKKAKKKGGKIMKLIGKCERPFVRFLRYSVRERKPPYALGLKQVLLLCILSVPLILALLISCCFLFGYPYLGAENMHG